MSLGFLRIERVEAGGHRLPGFIHNLRKGIWKTIYAEISNVPDFAVGERHSPEKWGPRYQGCSGVGARS